MGRFIFAGSGRGLGEWRLARKTIGWAGSSSPVWGAAAASGASLEGPWMGRLIFAGLGRGRRECTSLEGPLDGPAHLRRFGARPPRLAPRSKDRGWVGSSSPVWGAAASGASLEGPLDGPVHFRRFGARPGRVASRPKDRWAGRLIFAGLGRGRREWASLEGPLGSSSPVRGPAGANSTLRLERAR